MSDGSLKFVQFEYGVALPPLKTMIPLTAK